MNQKGQNFIAFEHSKRKSVDQRIYAIQQTQNTQRFNKHMFENVGDSKVA